MATVRVTRRAQRDLVALTSALDLPDDTRERVRAHLQLLETSPKMGRRLRETGQRFVLGPWRWMLIVYRHDETADVVDVLTLQDARRATRPHSD